MNLVDVIKELNCGFYVINKIYLYSDKLSDKYIKFNNFSEFIDYIRQNNYDRKNFNTYYNAKEQNMYVGIL